MALRRSAARRWGVEELEPRLCLAAPPAFPGSPVVLPQEGDWLPGNPNVGSPIFADLDNDGRDELIAAASGGRMVAYTYRDGGIRLFQTYATDSPTNFRATPIVV